MAMLKFDCDFYRKACPDIELPKYSHNDVNVELEYLRSKNKKDIISFFSDMVWTALVTLLLGILVSFLFTWHYEFQNGLVNVVVASLVMVFLTICVTSKRTADGRYMFTWFSPKKDKAEFSLRLRLCQKQFSTYRENNDDKRFQQLWCYCNSALNRPHQL